MNAVYYDGGGSFSVGEASMQEPGPGEVRLDVAYCGVCGTDLHIAHGAMDARVRPPQVIGHEMSGTVAEVGERRRRLRVGDAVVVRPLDTRGETPADRGFSHISRNLKFLGIDAPGALQASWTVPAFTLHALPRRRRPAPRRARRAAGGRLPRRPPRRGRAPARRRSSSAAARSGC